MAEPLKLMYNEELIKRLSSKTKDVFSKFNISQFKKDVFDSEWDSRELKDRMYHISACLHNQFPKPISNAKEILLQLSDKLKENQQKNDGFAFIILPNYIEKFGTDDYETSVKLMEHITQLASCEFAVRPFILNHRKDMMNQMLDWSKHESELVRRFASEGCRPRLPWAMGLPELKKDPSEILPIIDNLIFDSSEFVRKSVSNNINDISKDHQDIAKSIIKKYIGKNQVTDKLLKHASRTLLKQGDSEILELFGSGDAKGLKVDNFKVLTPKVKLGDNLEFEFEISNCNGKDKSVRIEYNMYFMKANGKQAPKIFKISEKTIPSNKTVKLKRNQSFKAITTRKYYIGKHGVSIVLNGKEFEKLEFEVINS